VIVANTEWQACKLDHLGFVGRGKSKHRPRNDSLLYGGEYPFFQTGDIKAANFHLTEYSQTYNENGLAQSKLWQPGTLCITIAANIAETAILGIPGCFPDSVVGFIPDPDKADVRFIKYYVDTIKLQMQSVSRGTTQDNLSLDKLLTFDFRVPPLSVQRRIADILSAYDDLIENNRRRIQILEEMTRTLYREWFIHVIPLGDKPTGCTIGSLGDLCDLMKESFEEASQSELPLLDLSHIPSQSLAPNDTGKSSELTTARILFQPGDTLFGAIRSYLHKVVLAPYAGVTNVSVLVLRPRRAELRSLLAIVASSTDTIRWADQHSTGTKMPVINWNVLKTMPAPLPAPSIAARFEKIAGPMLDEICLLSVKNQVLRRTRNLLLPRLLSGELDVGKIPISGR
jgi:type I restriction enzyme S subunit